VELAGVPVQLGCVHEWFGEAPSQGHARQWMPPMCVLADLARRAVAQRAVAHVLWVGRRLWPYPLLFDQHREVLRRSILIDPPDNASRLWAIDLALRTPSAVAVIADGEGLTLPHTRRLQLAAATGGGGGALCLLARPPGELDRLSAATTRWRITHALSSTMRPRWTLALLRNKDRPALTDEPPSWTVEWNHAQGLICIPAVLADRTGSATAQAC
jgi:protein ImuA